MILINTDFSQLSHHKFLRIDTKYWGLQEKINFTSFKLLKELFWIIPGSVQTKYYTSEQTDVPYIRISDIDYKFGIDLDSSVYLNDECKIPDEKVLLENDLILATIGATVGKICKANEAVGGTVSNNTVILRAKEKNLNINFYEKLFQTDAYINYFHRIASQKAQPNLQLYDIENIKIPVISDEIIDEIIKTIDKKYLDIKNRRKQLINVDTITNEIFAKYFNFDISTFEKLKKLKKYQVDFASYGNNVDARFSAKFHRPAGTFVYSELEKTEHYKLKDVVSVPMITGQGISNEYDENGTCAYVSMADISSWELDLDGLKMVSSEYENKNSSKKIKGVSELQSTKLAINDIVMMRSGEGGIGKVAIVKDDINAIFCDFLIRIRVDTSIINPMFAYYYFRTKYFQYLIEINKKGLGNNTNIFPNILNEFPIPCIALNEQQIIINKIEEKIKEQNIIKKQIDAERDSIDTILEKLLIQ